MLVADLDADAVDGVRLGDRREQPVGKTHGVARADGQALDDGEFVSAQARGRIALAHDAVDPAGDRLQEPVARPDAPEPVVDGLAPVEIEIEDREPARATLGLGQTLLQALLEAEIG